MLEKFMNKETEFTSEKPYFSDKCDVITDRYDQNNQYLLINLSKYDEVIEDINLFDENLSKENEYIAKIFNKQSDHTFCLDDTKYLVFNW